MNPEQLKSTLESHAAWLAGNGGQRADLQSADLESADLQSADLRWANLESADLRWANLRWANLESADLRSADLRWANLESADLQSADLQLANLRSANLRSANLTGTGVNYAELGKYSVLSYPDRMVVGCQSRDHEWWYQLSLDRAERLDDGARDWWATYRDVCFAMMRASARVVYPVCEVAK